MASVGCGDGVCEEREQPQRKHHHKHQDKQPQGEKQKEAGSKKMIFAIGTVLKERWKIESLVAEGGFGQIYRAADLADGQRLVAVKAESLDAQLPLLRMELSVLKHLNDFRPRSPHILHFLGCGGNCQGNFLVMELCGKSMMELKKSTPEDRLSAGTSLRLASQMVSAMEKMHEAGWLHRDVKPSNFCLGRERGSRRTVFVIDFGLCRNYVDSNGNLRPPRSRCGFRGTLRYASVNIHQAKDMGRQDDLWSVFYILLEQNCGQLPWRRVSDKAKVLEMKMTSDFAKLLDKCPRSIGMLQEHLLGLNYFTKPDYDLLRRGFNEELERLQISDKDPFDWEAPMEASEMSAAHPGTPCPSVMEGESSKEY